VGLEFTSIVQEGINGTNKGITMKQGGARAGSSIAQLRVAHNRGRFWPVVVVGRG
jgi:hypothetical protein